MHNVSHSSKIRFTTLNSEWKLVAVKDIVDRVSKPVLVEEKTLYTQIGIRSHGKGLFYKDPVDGKSLGNKRVFWVEPDCFIVNIVFAWEQAVAKTTKAELGYIASHRFPMYKPKANKLDLDYLLYFFLTKKGKLLLEMASPGGAGRNKTLGQKEFESLRLNLPSLTEQQKIATFVTTIDKKLQLLKKQLQLLEQYKKGVMQQIFSQQLRFKDDKGKAFPDWEKWKFNNVYNFFSTNSLSRDKLNYEDGEVYNIHYGDIHTKFQTQFCLSKEVVPYINKEVSIRQIDDYFLKEGDLILADASEDLVDVGKNIEIISLEGKKAVAGLHTIHARPDLSKMQIGFGGYLMKSPDVRGKIMKVAQGSKVLSIAPSRLAELEILLPTKGEQSKIATFLSVIDVKINTVRQQLTLTQQWKKGLLQQMFV